MASAWCLRAPRRPDAFVRCQASRRVYRAMLHQHHSWIPPVPARGAQPVSSRDGRQRARGASFSLRSAFSANNQQISTLSRALFIVYMYAYICISARRCTSSSPDSAPAAGGRQFRFRSPQEPWHQHGVYERRVVQTLSSGVRRLVASIARCFTSTTHGFPRFRLAAHSPYLVETDDNARAVLHSVCAQPSQPTTNRSQLYLALYLLYIYMHIYVYVRRLSAVRLPSFLF
jgi:hypothetical protein